MSSKLHTTLLSNHRLEEANIGIVLWSRGGIFVDYEAIQVEYKTCMEVLLIVVEKLLSQIYLHCCNAFYCILTLTWWLLNTFLLSINCPPPQCLLSDIYDYVGGSCSSSRPYHAIWRAGWRGLSRSSFMSSNSFVLYLSDVQGLDGLQPSFCYWSYIQKAVVPLQCCPYYMERLNVLRTLALEDSSKAE